MSNLLYKPTEYTPLDFGNMFSPTQTTPPPMGNWGGSGVSFGGNSGLGLVNSSVVPTAAKQNWLQDIGFLGGKDGAGWGGLAIGALQGGANLFMGMKQYGMAKDALNQAKEQYNRNYAAQKQTTNASLEDRQRARNASSPNAYVSVDEYMAQNGIK